MPLTLDQYASTYLPGRGLPWPVAPTPEVRPLFNELWKARAEVVLNGHNHSYERFGPQDADSNFQAHGVRQFVIGTGGAQLCVPRPAMPCSSILA